MEDEYGCKHHGTTISNAAL